MATSLTLENDSSLAQGYLKVNGSTAATLTTSGITGNLTGNLTGNVTGSLTAGGSLKFATAQTASGTSVDFTGIPSWAKRVNVIIKGVSTSGTSVIQVQIGSGIIMNSSYSATASYGSGANLFLYATSGFILDVPNSVGATIQRSGIIQLSLIDSNTWVASGNISVGSVGQVTNACAGTSPALGGSLDRLRITTVNGTDTFDTGTINISYEG